jgi:hypothetical protein
MQNVRALLPPSFWVLVALAELIDQVRLIPEEGRLEIELLDDLAAAKSPSRRTGTGCK